MVSCWLGRAEAAARRAEDALRADAAVVDTCTEDGVCCWDEGGLIEPLLAIFGGEVLPRPDMRSSVVSVVVGIGEMGECASGDSGVLHRSFVVVVSVREKKNQY